MIKVLLNRAKFEKFKFYALYIPSYHLRCFFIRAAYLEWGAYQEWGGISGFVKLSVRGWGWGHKDPSGGNAPSHHLCSGKAHMNSASIYNFSNVF